MVVLCSLGMYTATAHPDSGNAVVIRSPEPSHLDALRDHLLPDLVIDDDAAVLARDEWAHALEAIARDIDYESFEDQSRT